MKYIKFLYCIILCVIIFTCCEMNKQDPVKTQTTDSQIVIHEEDSACIADELYYFVLSRKPLLTNWDSSENKRGIMLSFDISSDGDTTFEITATYRNEELHDFTGVAFYDDFFVIIFDEKNLGSKYYNAKLLNHPQNFEENNQRYGIVTFGLLKNGHFFEDNWDFE